MNIKYLKNTLLKFTTGLILTIPLIISTITTQSLTVYADVDSTYGTIVNAIGDDIKARTGTIDGGVETKDTGYLCYLLDDNGNGIEGTEAVALYSPGYQQRPGSKWIAKSRKGGYTAEEWRGQAEWGCTPWVAQSYETNVEQIKAYFNEKLPDGTTRAQDFVERIWGEEMMLKFQSNEVHIVIETLLNFQLSDSVSGTTHDDEYYEITAGSLMLTELENEIPSWSDAQVAYMYCEAMNSGHDTQLAKDIEAEIKEAKNPSLKRKHYTDLIEEKLPKTSGWAHTRDDLVVEKLKEADQKGGYEKVGDPYIGTVPNFLQKIEDFKIKNCFKEFLNKVAPKTERIEKDQCGFSLVDVSPEYLDPGVVKNENSGLALIIISGEGGGQTTCDESVAPTTPVHPAPNESTGTMTIVKNYRSLQADGTYKEDGCKIRTQVASKITIEDESKYGYTVKAWKITSDPTPTTDVDSTKWESEMTNTSKVGAIQKEGTKTGEVELTAPSTTLYLLLERTADIDIQTTYDESQGDTPAPPAKESEGTMQIVKSYRINKGGTYEDKGTYSITNISENILIEDEQSYKVVGWKTSTSTSTSVDSRTWNTSVPPNIVTTGTKATTVTLDTTKNVKTLYVLLEKQEAESEDYNYKLTQSQITRRVWFSTPDNKLTNMTEQILEHDFQLVKPGHSDHCSGHTVYTVCHGHVDYDGCKNTLDCSNTSLFHIHTDDCYTCGGHPYKRDDYACYECTDTDYCSGWVWTDTTMNMSVDATLTNADTAVVWSGVSDTYKAHTVKGSTGLSKTWYKDQVSWTTSDGIHIGTYTNWPSKDTTVNKNWNYIALLVRGKDKVTISDWKNDGTTKSILNEMLSSKGFQIANKPSATRYTTGAGTNTFYKDKFTATFNKDSNGDYITIRKPTIKVEHPKDNSGICGPESQEAYLASPMTINDITLKIEVYTGTEDLSGQSVSYNRTEEHDPIYGSWKIQKNTTSGTRVQATDITFYPYIQMKYDTLTTPNQTAYVMGEYKRTIKTNAYGEVEWDTYNPSGIGNLTVNSSQFSTHANAKSHPAGTVLPGGATLTLKVKDDDSRTLTVRTYQVILDGAGKEQVEKTTGSSISDNLTESYATQQHNTFVNTVVSALQNTKINQYVSKDDTITDAMTLCKDSNRVSSGSSISYLNNGSSYASKESKYYLQGKSGESNSPYLDAKITGTNTQRYVISSNTSGDILLDGDKILSKSQSASSLSNETAKELDEKTKVISEFAAAIERNSGSDTTATWATDGKWYNEAFDGLTILVTETTIKVGTWQPNERHTVLDPKLIPQQTKKTSSWSFFSTAWRTDNYSQNYKNDPTKIGEFRGKTVKLVEYKSLFVSNKVLYIPSVTTQDLR
jgi:hypothetical protein